MMSITSLTRLSLQRARPGQSVQLRLHQERKERSFSRLDSEYVLVWRACLKELPMTLR